MKFNVSVKQFKHFQGPEGQKPGTKRRNKIKDELKKGMTDGTDVTMERLFIVRLPNVEDHKGHSLDPLVILTII